MMSAAAAKAIRGLSTRRQTYLVLLWLVLLISATATATATATSVDGASDLNDSYLLKDVVKAIATKERWDPEATSGIRVLRLDNRKVRIGSLQKYDFYVLAVKKVLFKFSDDVASWKKLRNGGKGEDFGSGLFAEVNGDLNRRYYIKPFELEGPVELHAAGEDDISLLLRSNVTYTGLRRIIVGDGIDIKLEGAREVSLVLPSNSGLLLNRSSTMVKEHNNHLLTRQNAACPPLLSAYIRGPVNVAAYRVRDPSDYIETSFHSDDIVELLPEDQDDSGPFRFPPSFSIGSFSSKVDLLEKLLTRLFGKTVSLDKPPQLVKANIESSTLLKFRLELERDIGPDDKIWKKVAKWRTRVLVQRTQFEVVAALEEGRPLKPVLVKKLNNPFATADTTAWSNLMSNASFTKLPSIVAPPEPLTLDVNW